MTKQSVYVHLRDLCTVNQGLQIPISKRFRTSGKDRFFYITVQFLKDGHKEKYYVENPPKSSICNPDDIIIVRTGSTGQILTGITGCFHNNFFKVNYNKDLIIGRYLYYCLSTREKQNEMKLRAGITTIPDLNHFMFLDIKVPLIPYHDQKNLVSVLDLINNKIELNNRINDELEAMAKLIYEYWFVQFDFPYDFHQLKPADETSRAEDVKSYKSVGGKMVWNKDLNRDIPEGWEVKPVDYWIEKDKNGDWGKEEVQGNYDLRVSCIRGADINGLNGKGEIKSPVRFILDKNNHKLLEPGDLVIEISGGSPTQSTGRLGYIINETLERFNEPIICSNFCKAITLKNESTQFNFIYEWKRLYDAGVFFGYEGKTSGIKNFLFESFVSKHKISIPPVDLIEAFYEKAITLHSKIQKNLIQNQELASLRDWLLPMLMNGQVTVVDAEEMVEEKLGMVAEERVKYGKSVALNIPENRKGFAKQVLAGKIVSEFRNDSNFTSIKFQKIQFLAEHLIEADLNLNYYYQAAGPYDNRFMHTIYNDFRKQKWFDCQNTRFIPLEKKEKIEGYYQGYFAPAQNQLASLFDLLYPKSEAEVEIIATAYAVWNNRVIEGRTLEESELVEDFYLWSDRKKQYSKEQILSGLKCLKDNKMEPKGFGKLIKKAKKIN